MAKDWEYAAGILWPVLVDAAKKKRRLTYGELAPLIGYKLAVPVKFALEPIQNFCLEKSIPILTALVVNKNTQKPGTGCLGVDDIDEVYQYDWDSIGNPFKKNTFRKVELRDFIRFVKLLDGVTLKTLKKRRSFRIDVGERRISFTPESSGALRSIPFDPDIKRYLDIYNANGGISKTTKYHGRTPRLMNASYFLAIMAEYTKPKNRILIEDTSNTSKEIITERDALVKRRYGQSKFRNSLLDYWGNACSVTNFSNESLLRASHIKPWAISNSVERLNMFNGLLLIPNLDAMFNDGFITFEDDGKIRISHEISSDDLKILGVDHFMSIRKDKIRAGHKTFLSYHRTNIFHAWGEN